MAGKLQAEIAQSKPFGSIEEEAFLNLAKTTDMLQQVLETVLKPHGISHTQYNVLRILRGAGDAGLPCKQIAARMISHDPDITRLVDRMEKPGLVTRVRSAADRRVVVVRITPDGLQLIERVDQPMKIILRERFAHLHKTKPRGVSGIARIDPAIGYGSL